MEINTWRLGPAQDLYLAEVTDVVIYPPFLHLPVLNPGAGELLTEAVGGREDPDLVDEGTATLGPLLQPEEDVPGDVPGQTPADDPEEQN